MSMKKIIAGVAAAALAVGSLAVVASAEDETKVFNFVGKEGKMTLNYSATKSFLGGIDKEDLFGTNATEEYHLVFNSTLSLKKGFDSKPAYLNAVNQILAENKVQNWDATKITVTGRNYRGNTVTVEATARTRYVAPNYAGEYALFRARLQNDGHPEVNTWDLDLTDVETVTRITISSAIDVNTKGYYVAANACDLVMIPMIYGTNQHLTIGDADFGDDNSKYGWYTSSSADNSGKVLYLNTDATEKLAQAYCLEGEEKADGTYSEHEIGADAYGRPEYATSLGSNTLRWVNDNIVQQKGAKLRITFMKPKELTDAITAGGVSVYPTHTDNNSGSQVLTPGTVGSSVSQDITIGVNLRNTTKLQQTTNIVDYVAEFDWDTLVQNSASTVSGNVDSIAFRLNNTSKNVRNTILGLDDNNREVFGIKTIEIVIPDQASVPNGSDPARIITAGSADTFVKLIGTEKTIYGNGAAEVAVENNITNNNVSYAVKLMDVNGAYVQPAGEVTLQLSIPTDFRGRTLSSDKVRHTCNDGTVEELAIQNMETYKTDNYIVVKTSKFSGFDFSFEDAATEATTEAPVETTTEAPVETTVAPVETTAAPAAPSEDKNANTGVVLAVVPAAVAAAAVVISKKRK